MTFEEKLEELNLHIRKLNNLYGGSGLEWGMRYESLLNGENSIHHLKNIAYLASQIADKSMELVKEVDDVRTKEIKCKE